MKVFCLDQECWLPRPRTEVFPFFADATNLPTITPDSMHFSILTPRPLVMGRGLLIDYALRVHGLPVRWQSEITAWEPPFRFIDEQRRGPYRFWKHEHTFEEHDGGTRARDSVQYAVWGGALVNHLFVRRDLEKIFAFRRAKMLELIG